MKTYLILFLPSVLAVIDVHISGSFHTNLTVTVTGVDKAVITDSERASFNITDDVLKDCVKQFLGGRPDDAFIHGPTPWGDLFKKYGWTETYRVLRPLTGRVVSIASSPQILRQMETNKTVNIFKEIYNRIAISWSTPDLSVERVNGHIDVDNFVMAFNSPYGENWHRLKGMTVGVNLANVESESIVELYATRVFFKIEVTYQATLWGNAVLNYAKAFRGHHFYSPNLEDIIINCGLTNSLEVKEVIDAGFYMDAKVVVRNKSNGLVALTRNIDVRPV